MATAAAPTGASTAPSSTSEVLDATTIAPEPTTEEVTSTQPATTDAVASTDPVPPTSELTGPEPAVTEPPASTEAVAEVLAIVENFTITIGDTVSEGVPAPGAGNIEAAGDEDVYTFDATAGQEVLFSRLAGGLDLTWTLSAPDGSEVFDSAFGDQLVTLTQTGTFTLTVAGQAPTDVGTYEFTLDDVAGNIDEIGIFIGAFVSDGDPAPGAGNIESPGAVDVYRFDADERQLLFFDDLDTSSFDFDWTLAAPSGAVVFSAVALLDAEATMPERGTYTLTVSGSSASVVGTYEFRIFEVEPPQVFAIGFGDTVAQGVPAAGAGDVERPGSVDIYTFEAAAGQVAILKVLVGNTDMAWDLTDPDGSVVLDSTFVISDELVPLAVTGTYTLTVDGFAFNNSGTYSFQLLAGPPPEEFSIESGDTVADGVPSSGAGNIEVAGATDVYSFDAIAGQHMLFDVRESNFDLEWALAAPDGSELFSGVLSNTDVPVSLPQAGRYTLIVAGRLLFELGNGTYSFQLIEEVSANDPPVGVDDVFEVAEGEMLVVAAPGVLANDSDPDGDVISVGNLIAPVNGALTMQQVGSFQYTPDSGFSGVDSFRYELEDDHGNSAGEFVDVVITVIAAPDPTTTTDAPNGPPVGVDDAFEVAENTSLNVAAPGLLANDSDPEGDPIEVTGVIQPANGLVQSSGAGSFAFTPDPGFTGVDSFLYEVSDDQGNSTGLVVEVVITVTPESTDPPGSEPNSPPIGVDDAFEVVEGTTLNVAAPGLLANDSDPDGDPISVPSASVPANGSLSGQQVGSFQYTPDPGFIGVDSFRYAVDDDQGNTTGVVVEVVITVVAAPDPTTTTDAPNGPPVGVDDAFEVAEGETLDVAVPGLLANDSDPEGDPIRVSLVTEPANGDSSVFQVGSFQYTPDPGFTGIDSFRYEVSDDQGNSTGLVVEVVITVTAAQEPTTSTTAATTEPASSTTEGEAVDPASDADSGQPADPAPSEPAPDVDPAPPTNPGGTGSTVGSEPIEPAVAVAGAGGTSDPAVTTTTAPPGTLPATGAEPIALRLGALLIVGGSVVVALGTIATRGPRRAGRDNDVHR